MPHVWTAGGISSLVPSLTALEASMTAGGAYPRAVGAAGGWMVPVQALVGV